MLHHCRNSAKVIYLAMRHLYPNETWRVIASYGHATVTSGTPKQLSDYLYNDGPADFMIAEPLFNELRDLMSNPKTWQVMDNKQDILSFNP